MKYISELLYHHECVIIPDFGGFVSNYESAHIDRGKNLFHPPRKKVLFNSWLNSNDGILANFIAQSEGISYKAAMSVIEKFTSSCIKKMDAEKKVRLQGIGLLFKDENGNIQFEQETEINYLQQAFGLNSFHSPAIHRSSEIAYYNRALKDKEKHTTGRKWIYNLRWAAIIIPLLMLTVWGLLNRDTLWQKYNTYATYLFSNTKESKKNTPELEKAEQTAKKKEKTNAPYEINHSSFLPSSSESLTKNDNPEDLTSQKSAPKSNDINEKTAAAVEKETNNEDKYDFHGYFVITGSFKTVKNAQKHISELRRFGFSAAIVDKNYQGYHRVAALKENSRKRALRKLNIIRLEDYPDAWLLVK